MSPSPADDIAGRPFPKRDKQRRITAEAFTFPDGSIFHIRLVQYGWETDYSGECFNYKTLHDAREARYYKLMDICAILSKKARGI